MQQNTGGLRIWGQLDGQWYAFGHGTPLVSSDMTVVAQVQEQVSYYGLPTLFAHLKKCNLLHPVQVMIDYRRNPQVK